MKKNNSKQSQNLLRDTLVASTTGGEMIFAPTLPASGELAAVLSPAAYLLGSFKSFLIGLRAAIKNKQVLISTGVLTALWITVTVLTRMGLSGRILDALNFLTFAQSGCGGGILAITGTSLGKGVVSYFLFRFILPLFSGQKTFNGISGGFKTLFSSFGAVKNTSAFSALFFGIGVALVVYNFMAGKTLVANSLVGIGALLISLQALSQRAGFLRGLLTSWAHQYSKSNALNAGFINSLLAGWTSGFAIAIALSVTHVEYICYLFGGVAVAAGLILVIAGKYKGSKVPAAIALLFLTAFFSLGLSSPALAGDDSKGLPYHDYAKYSYFVSNVHVSPNYGTERTLKVHIPITVRDKKSQIILSSDTITITFDNLPLNKTLAQEGGLSFTTGSRFDFELSIPSQGISSEKEVGEIWEKEYVARSPNMQKTNLFGYPALQSVNDTYADFIIFLKNVQLPTGIAVFKISINASINCGMQNNTTQCDMFREKYKAQQVPAFQNLYKQFGGITVRVEKEVQLRNYPSKAAPAVVDQVKESQASKTAGETSVPVAVAIVAAGVVAALAGAGAAAGAAAGQGASSNNEKPQESTYKMALKKDFGDKIKYNADSVTVYARMIEVTAEGAEIDRPDLTQRISIFSENPLLEVSAGVMSGSYLGAGVIAGKAAKAQTNVEVILSFRFTGEGGTFQNNVKFKIVGECSIELEAEKIFLLAASGRSFELPYEFMNFIMEPTDVTVKAMKDGVPFDLSLGKNKEGKPVIVATDKAEKKPTVQFFESFPCEIVAKNEKESARTVFSTVLCYEGILPDFLGKEKEIVAYQNAEGEMPVTNIAFRLGLWDEAKKNLAMSRPKEIEVDFSDEQGVFEVIGLENEIDTGKSTSEYVLYAFKAEKSLPSPAPVPGILSVIYRSDTASFESATAVKLIPDLLTYEKEREKEFQNCKRIINTYMAVRFRVQKLKELREGYDKMGLRDLQLFRQKCWEIASRCILQEKESYLIDSYWYDEAIATAELVVYVGDIALDVALAPFGGPIAGFVIGQVKSGLLELIAVRIEKGGVSYAAIYKLIMKRLEQAAGQADGLIETPGFDKPKALVAWLSCYVLYRIMFHWYFDKEDNGDPKGLVEAVQSGLMDFAGKGVSLLLGEFAKGIAKERGLDLHSTADKEQQWVNDKVSKGAKKGLDAMDHAAETLDKKIEEIKTVLVGYIEKIRSGAVSL